MPRGYRNNIIKDWRDDLEVGDVLLTKAGKPRAIRQISRRYGLLGCVTFSIQRHSWTNRPYTVKSRSDLKTEGYTKAPVRLKKMSIWDKRLLADIGRAGPSSLQKLTPEDVRGWL